LFRSASAQESLMDIYQRALQNDPAIREAEARFLANSEVYPQARSSLLPNLSFSASRSHNFNRDPNPPANPFTGAPEPGFGGTESEGDSTGWNINISQTVFDWGQILSLRQAEKRVAQAETEFEAARQDLLIRVATAYFDVLAAED